MKTLIPLLVLGFTSVATAQNRVGIFNENPQTTLQVSGPVQNENIGIEGQQVISPTIRVEELNSTNNPDVFNNGIISSPLKVNSDGDLVLDENIFTDTKNLTDNYSFLTPTNRFVTSSSKIITSNLEVKEQSLVHVQATITATIQQTNFNGQNFNTSSNIASFTQYNVQETKRLYSYFIIIDQDGVKPDQICGLSDSFIINRYQRNNAASSIPTSVITETFTKLEPGNYSIEHHFGYDSGAQTKAPSELPGFFRANHSVNNNNYTLTVYPL